MSTLRADDRVVGTRQRRQAEYIRRGSGKDEEGLTGRSEGLLDPGHSPFGIVVVTIGERVPTIRRDDGIEDACMHRRIVVTGEVMLGTWTMGQAFDSHRFSLRNSQCVMVMQKGAG